MIIEDGVNTSDSPDEETSESLSDEGEDSPSKTDGRPELNVLKEENRKLAKTLRKQQEQMQSLLEEKESRLEELQDKTRLSSSEKQEMATLEQQVEMITSDPKSKPWLKLNEKISKKATREVVEDYDNTIAIRNARKYAKQEGIPFDKFEKEIVKFVRRTDSSLMPSERMDEAYELFLEEKKFKDREAKLVEKEKNFVDGGTKAPAKKVLSREDAKKHAMSSDEETMKFLKSVHSRQQAEREATQR